MSSYNLRTTSLNESKLDAELLKRGAKTFGSIKRKQERLQRFMESEARDNEAREILRQAVYEQQQKVQTRSRSRALELIAAYLG